MRNEQAEQGSRREGSQLAVPMGRRANLRGVLWATAVAVALCVATTSHAQEQPSPQAPAGCTGLTHTGAERAETLPRPAHPAVREVEAGSPAERAELRPGDILVEVNGVDTRDLEWLFAGPPYTVHRILVRRSEEVHEAALTLGRAMFPVRLDRTVGAAVCMSFGPGGEP